MEKIKRMLLALCDEMTVSGYERRAQGKIIEMCQGAFDQVETDFLGNILLLKRSTRRSPKKLLIDCHLDNVGMMVTDIKKGGFLSIVNVGGLDTRVLPATEVTVYGRKPIYGLITSTPPHLVNKSQDSVPKLSELYVDTGYSKEELEKIVEIGDPVGYRFVATEMENGYITAPGLDDKACICGVIDAVSKMDSEKLAYDVYVTISAQEETGKNGSARAAFRINPDIAITTDVNFAKGDGTPDYESIKCREGASVDVSSLCDKALTRNIIKLLKDKGIKHQIICEPGRTCTNNEGLLMGGLGARTAVLSVPLKNMHTPSETVNLGDILSLSQILCAVVCEENI